MKKGVVCIVSFCCILRIVLIGCGRMPKEYRGMESDYEVGYRDGKDAGYVEGYKDGTQYTANFIIESMDEEYRKEFLAQYSDELAEHEIYY